MSEVRIRRFQKDDAAATALVFYDAVHRATGAFYDAVQRNAWAPKVPDEEAWLARIAPQAAFVAERDGAVVGFMTLRSDGYLDLAYVAPASVGQGVAKALYDALLAEARGTKLDTLTSDASHLARRFFARQGWTVVREQTVERNGVALTNFRMKLDLPPRG